MTTLRDITAALEAVGQVVRAPVASPALSGVTEDSRRVTPGALFCAVAGSARDGHAFLPDAVARGAAAALVARPVAEIPIPVVAVRDSRIAAAVAAARWYGTPGAALRLVGVTGTNGKSTTVALIRHLLAGDEPVGAIGTLGAIDGAGRPAGDEPIALTTPGAVALQGVLAALVARGVTTVVLEASSHALDQQRLYGLRFAAAVYTNLTHDHLDYHGDLAAYRNAKLRLSTLLAAGGAEVVNADDPAWSALPRRAELDRVTFGVARPADVAATDVRLGAGGSRFTLRCGDRAVDARLPLLGAFNVSNALGAAAATWRLGRGPEELAQRLATAPAVPGRLEPIGGDGLMVLRDYAHTPDALERAIDALRPVTRGRLLVLFGCGGDRDRKKRPVMGRIAARRADVAIVTSDNPRTEDPERIIDEIEDGMEGVAHVRITDRREAIGRAVRMLQPGDCLLLAGKGHETYQIIGERRLPFDEREVVQQALATRVGA
jgi:UDP-N-acetylmuramoyl-L-alanyl-D-glutamate--2,6-diaminopimelate ligase